MKKFICICSFIALALTVNAQNVDSLCCQNVDFYLMTTEISEIDSTSTMIDLSMQTPKLTTIPQEVFVAKNVKFINVSFNRVGTIPEAIKDLKELQCIDLSGNHYLNKLPDFLKDMPNLKVIKITDLAEWSAEKKESVKKQFPNITFIF